MLRLTHSDVLKLLPDRMADSHKGDYGKLLLICGSRRYTGAPALATMGALRTGAGLVFLAVPDCIHAIEAVKLSEPVILALDSNDGMISADSYKKILPMIDKIDAVLIGPGLGQSNGTETMVCKVLEHFNGPAVVDADGINVLVHHKDIIRKRTGATILTPHEGEFLRFGGLLDEGRVCGAKKLASELECVVVLKGHETVITDGCVTYINSTGNPGMATGGCGDVLAGITTALLGFGIDPLKAAAAGAWIHGAAGDLCADSMGQYSMLPSDMISVLYRLLK